MPLHAVALGLRVSALSLFTLTACATPGDVPPPLSSAASAALKATYFHDVPIHDPDNPGLQASNCLSVAEDDRGHLDFELQLFFLAGHSCQLSGTAAPVTPGLWRFETPSHDGEGACVLELTRDASGSWHLKDRTDCQTDHCGAHGRIDHLFPSDTRDVHWGCL